MLELVELILDYRYIFGHMCIYIVSVVQEIYIYIYIYNVYIYIQYL